MKSFSQTLVIGLVVLVPMAQAQNNSAASNTNTIVVEAGAAAVNQPTTVVEASPLSDSRADKMRKQRQDTEVETEQKIVEKLEQSRLEDEKERADRLFGGKLDKKKEEAKVEEKAIIVAPVYTEHQMPQQQVVITSEPEKRVTADDLSNTKREILDAIRADQTVIAVAPAPEKPKPRYYMSALLGKADYTNAVNVQGKGAAGFLVGTDMRNHFMVEGGLLYSNYFIENNYFWGPNGNGAAVFKELDQYNIGMTVKYSPLSGRFKPLVGLGVNYTYRKYFDRAYVDWGGVYEIPDGNEATSNAIDMGYLLGLEMGISDTFSIGVDYRWNTNLIYRTDSEIIDRRYRAAGTELVEEADYSIFTINAKVLF